MTKEIQAPLPGFGKLIANGFSAHTLSVTLRDVTHTAESDKWGGIATHTPQATTAEAHRPSSAPL
jgi:hypothetical protein